MAVEKTHETEISATPEIRALADAELDSVAGAGVLSWFRDKVLERIWDEATDGCAFVCQYNKVRVANGQKPI